MINQELLARVKTMPDISFGEDKDFTLQNLIRQMEDEIAVLERALEFADKEVSQLAQLACSTIGWKFIPDNYKSYFIQQAKAELAKE